MVLKGDRQKELLTTSEFHAWFPQQPYRKPVTLEGVSEYLADFSVGSVAKSPSRSKCGRCRQGHARACFRRDAAKHPSMGNLLAPSTADSTWIV